jgi:enoyl-CoA hydratase/carnithine racemase
MPPAPIPLDALAGSPPEGPLLVVDLDAPSAVPPAPLHTGLSAVVLGVTTHEPLTHPGAVACDVVLAAGDPAIDAIARTVAANPRAAVALALLLRGTGRSVDEGLHAESAVYSTLQAGPELARWRARRPVRPRGTEGDPVRLAREGPVLTITLARPHVRNALDAAMRDALVDAFQLVAADPSIAEVHLRGDGAAFCAGGDLDEFGSFPDPTTAHLVRLQQSVGRCIDAVATRVTAHLYGACAGSGIELPAFAGRVVAAPDTRIALPEVAMGLIPGAGGTVSIPRRIGRWRTARLALTGEWLDVATALDWGLVDEVVPGGDHERGGGAIIER